MTAVPGSRLPLILDDSLLSSFLAASHERRGDDDSGLPLDMLHPAYHHADGSSPEEQQPYVESGSDPPRRCGSNRCLKQ